MRDNWAGNVRFRAAGTRRPESVSQLRELARGAEKIKALGSRHSFSRVADTAGVLVSLDRLPSAVQVDPERRTATVGGGATYAEICPQLHRAGFALRNLASLPDITVAGACATATHGGGGRNGNLASAIAALEMVSADGEIIRLSRERDGDFFPGAAVGLGGLGIVVNVALDLIPAFEARQDVYEGLEMCVLLDRAEEILSAAHSVSVFTDWSGGPCRAWVKRKLPEEDGDAAGDFFGASRQRAPLHPVSGRSAEGCTGQMGIPAPWHERLPHFVPGRTSAAGDELQSEYFVPIARARDALSATLSLGADFAPLLFASEIRAVAADDLWASPCHGRDSLALHFTWRKDCPALRKLLPRMESALAPLDVRPHWGKLFTVSPERLRALYPRLPDFRDLARRLDPSGKFRNDFLDSLVFGGN